VANARLQSGSLALIFSNTHTHTHTQADDAMSKSEELANDGVECESQLQITSEL